MEGLVSTGLPRLVSQYLRAKNLKHPLAYRQIRTFGRPYTVEYVEYSWYLEYSQNLEYRGGGLEFSLNFSLN